MKKFTITTIIVLMTNLLMAQWIQQAPVTGQSLQDICFVDQYNGWCVGENGAHYYTKNGGELWELMENLNAEDLEKVVFVDSNHGWVGGDDGLFRTTNGGCGTSGNWDHLYDDSRAIPHFTDSLNGWILFSYSSYPVDFHILSKTSDGGDNFSGGEGWVGFVKDYTFTDPMNGWVVGLVEIYSFYPRVCRTINGGQTWAYSLMSSPISMVKSISSPYSSAAWIIGGGADGDAILHTSNGGVTWDQQGTYLEQDLNDIAFSDDMNGWVVGTSGRILHTSDGGQNWEYQDSGTSANLNVVFFIDNEQGWICGDNGTILHTDDGGIVGLDKSKQNQTCLSVFPNPSNGIVTISYASQLNEDITLSIYNDFGQNIKSIIFKNENNFRYKLSCSDLLAGIYFIKITTETEIIAEKLIIK